MSRQSELKKYQVLPLNYKVALAESRINEAVEKFGLENCYVSFSGGKDSTVLLHIARRLYPSIKAVFFDTGLEYPEIRDFVKTLENVEWLRPKTSFKKVLDKYGFPVISKSIAMAISRMRNAVKFIKNTTDKDSISAKEIQIDLRLNGGVNPTSGRTQNTGVIPKKWHDLALNGYYKISDECCNALKKKPAKRYYKEHGGCALIGTMASDSMNRRLDYYKHGCNAFDKKMPQARPLMFWNESDVWQYIKENGVKYCKVYDMGCDRTGCIFCLFGIEKDRDRFVRLKQTHPKQWEYCIDVLGYDKILASLGIESGVEKEDIKEPEIVNDEPLYVEIEYDDDQQGFFDFSGNVVYNEMLLNNAMVGVLDRAPP